MAECLKVTIENGIAHVLFNRPETYNAMNPEVLETLAMRFTSLALDSSARAVVISGEGKAFSSGADLKVIFNAPAGVLTTIYHLAGVLHRAITEIRRLNKPVIAAINGVAAGAGFSTALASDFRVMARSAILRQVYTSWGLCIDGGGTFTLPRLVGYARALEIAAFDKPISSEQALEWGLVTKVVDDGKAEEEAFAMARELMDRSIHSFGHVKRLINDSYENSLEVQLERERDAITTCVQHRDALEGITAFIQKRKPVYKK